MKVLLITILAVGLTFTPTPRVSGEDLSSAVVGTWKITSFTRKEVTTGKSAATFGEPPTGYAFFTKGGRFLIFATAKDRKKNEKPEPTDGERVDLFKSMFAWGGNYKVEASKVIYSVDIAWVPSWIGTTRTYEAQVDGNKLTITTPPFKSAQDGQDIIVVTTYERTE
jgi:hypothetical protein